MTRDEIRAKGARPQKTAAQIPTESAEQQWIFRWATYAKAMAEQWAGKAEEVDNG